MFNYFNKQDNKGEGSPKHSRKSSDESNSSAQNGKGDRSEVLSLQSKLKKLKEAFIKERYDKENAVKQKDSVQGEFDTMKNELREKEKHILRLKSENNELLDKLQVERKKNENVTKTPTHEKDEHGISSYFGGFGIFGKSDKSSSDEYNKLLSDHNYLKRQLEAVVEKLTKAEREVYDVKKDYRAKIDNLDKEKAELQKQLDERAAQKRQLQADNDKLQATNVELLKEKDSISQECRRLRRENDLLEQEKKELQDSNKEKMKMVADINEVCQRMEKEISKLADDKKQLKAELEESQLSMQVFKLKKVGKMVDTPALLIIRRNVADELLVEIENAGDKLVLFPQAVHSFGPADGKDDRFYIQYKAPSGTVDKDFYTCDEMKRILRTLKAFMRAASESNQKSDTSKKEKNLFSQVASFFSS